MSKLNSVHDYTIAVDTEFRGPYTLTLQAAMRVQGTMAVQLYRSALIPDVPTDLTIDSYLPPDKYDRFCADIKLLPSKFLTPDLSPAHLLRDLLGDSQMHILTRSVGEQLIESWDADNQSVPPNVTSGRYGRWRIPEIRLVLVGHFLRADLCRLFGRKFFGEMADADVRIRERKYLQFVEHDRPGPVVEYVQRGGDFFQVRLDTRDTMYPYDRAGLEAHSKTFLGIGKSDKLSVTDKQDMEATFNTRTHDAYGYAVVDAVNTLLVWEQMEVKDLEIYQAFGWRDEDVPTLRPTQGSRVSTFIKQTLTAEMLNNDIYTQVSGRTLEALMKRSGVGLLTDRLDASKFAKQTFGTHGGLLFTRSPKRFWHEASGNLRDVDMSGCYNSIIGKLNVYWGRPVIFEPGSASWTLSRAVGFLQVNCPADGWVVRVTGDITTSPNALVPSTENALTSANYQAKPGKRRQSKQRVFRLEALRDPAAVKGTRSSKLYSRRIESGIVTSATWLMIQAQPVGLRQEYEGLTVDSIVFYPSKLLARSAAEYADLVARYRSDQLSWEATLNLDAMEIVERSRIDDEYVSFQYPIGNYARKFGEFRKQAQATEGKGSGADLAWKVHANAMYGVLASPLLPTNNTVAANVVTAHARAEAFAMAQALNAIQTITDGCTYRLDQIPVCTYRECLVRKPDYPICRADAGDGIPFLDPATIPHDGAGFTDWYRSHVMAFFEVSGAEYDEFFGTHGMEHKQTSVSKQIAFDALACDGAGNYAKCMRDQSGLWQVEDFAARSYGRGCKKEVQDWLVPAYSTDNLTALAPISKDRELLSFKKAAQKARKLLDSGVPEVLLPLGMECGKALNYKALKGSAFVFQTPEQRAAILKQWQKFEKRYRAGLELLAMRRSYGGRRQGSLSDLAADIYQMVQAGETNLITRLNLTKLPNYLVTKSMILAAELELAKKRAMEDLKALIDTRKLTMTAVVTGLTVDCDSVEVAA